jgi:hypothetical protein
MTYQQIGIPPEDAQFLETRKFQVNEIARIFRVPPHLIADMEHATFSNIEHQSIDFVVHTIRPWTVRWEQAISQRLMTEQERRRYFSEFLLDGLMRGDVMSRYQAYAIGRQNGWLSADDIRELENMNPLARGGDTYLVPLNMVPAGGSRGAGEQRGGGENARMVQLANGVEVRASQMEAALARQRLQVAYMRLYEDVAGRVLRREANDVANAARRLLKPSRAEGDQAAFLDWLAEFYISHEAFVEKQFRPLTETYAEQIVELAAEELEQPPPLIENFLDAYLAELATRQVHKSQARIEAVLAEHRDAPLDPLLEELETWRTDQPVRVARDESVRASNAVALAAYGAMRVVRKVWVTFGKSCPFCTALGGKVVGIETFFLPADVDFAPPGAATPLKPRVNVGHAPAHGGCDCQVVAA